MTKLIKLLNKLEPSHTLESIAYTLAELNEMSVTEFATQIEQNPRMAAAVDLLATQGGIWAKLTTDTKTSDDFPKTRQTCDLYTRFRALRDEALDEINARKLIQELKRIADAFADLQA